VRELENVIQRALILSTGPEIGVEHLHLAPVPVSEARRTVVEAGAPETDKRVDNMKDLERDHILRTLAEVGGSRKLAIERLGISERTLRYKLQQYRDEGYFKD
jgi:two-component system response regulator FlrC